MANEDHETPFEHDFLRWGSTAVLLLTLFLAIFGSKLMASVPDRSGY